MTLEAMLDKKEQELIVQAALNDCKSIDNELIEAHQALEYAENQATAANLLLYMSYLHLNFPEVHAFKLIATPRRSDDFTIFLYDASGKTLDVFSPTPGVLYRGEWEKHSDSYSDVKNFSYEFFSHIAPLVRPHNVSDEIFNVAEELKAFK